MSVQNLTFTSRGSETIVDLQTGAAGTDGITVILSNETHTFSADATGDVDTNNFSSTVQVFLGATPASFVGSGTTFPTTAGQYRISASSSDSMNWGNPIIETQGSNGRIRVGTVPNANTSSTNAITLTIRVNNAGSNQTVTRTINLQSIVAGQAGGTGPQGAVGGTIALAVSRRTFVFRGNNTLVPDSNVVDNSNVRFDAIPNEGIDSDAPLRWSFAINGSSTYQSIYFTAPGDNSNLGFDIDTSSLSTSVVLDPRPNTNRRINNNRAITTVGTNNGYVGLVPVGVTDFTTSTIDGSVAANIVPGTTLRIFMNPNNQTGTDQQALLQSIRAGFQGQLRDINDNGIRFVAIDNAELIDVTGSGDNVVAVTVNIAVATGTGVLGTGGGLQNLGRFNWFNPGVLRTLQMTSTAFTRSASISSITMRVQGETLNDLLVTETESVSKLVQGTQITVTPTTTGGTGGDQSGVIVMDDQGNTSFVPDGNPGDDGDDVDVVWAYGTVGTTLPTPTFAMPPTGNAAAASGGVNWYATRAALELAVPSPASNQRIFTSIGNRRGSSTSFVWNVPNQSDARDGSDGQDSIMIDVVVLSDSNAFSNNTGANKVLRADILIGGNRCTDAELAAATSLTYRWGRSTATSDFTQFSNTAGNTDPNNFPDFGAAASIQRNDIPLPDGTGTATSGIEERFLVIAADDVTTGGAVNFVCQVANTA